VIFSLLCALFAFCALVSFVPWYADCVLGRPWVPAWRLRMLGEVHQLRGNTIQCAITINPPFNTNFPLPPPPSHCPPHCPPHCPSTLPLPSHSPLRTSIYPYIYSKMGTRIPLLMRVPGIAPSRTSALVESVDILPSLADAAAGVVVC
jgi:hypothetical protein